MMRQASGRNQRSKGLIVKNFLQVCILVVVFLWLLYQTKLSYDKNKALRENNSRILNNVAGSHFDVFSVARKDLTRSKVPASAGDQTPGNLGENEEVGEEEEDREVRRAMEDAEVIADDGFHDRDLEREDEDEQESISEEDKDDQVEEAEEAENIAEDHEHEEGSSQERHEKFYMGDDASSAVLQVNQRTGADDKNSSVQEKDTETNDTIDKKDDGSRYSNHDAIAASVIAAGDENSQSSIPTLIGANVEKIREGHFPVDNKPKEQVNSTIASKSYDSVKMQTQTDSLMVVPSNETARSGTPIMNSVEDPNSSRNMEEQLVRRNTTTEQKHLEKEIL